jgi:hypothetical protein
MFLFFIMNILVIFGEKAISLNELNKPSAIHAIADRLYIADGSTVYIYSLKEFSLIGKFGKAGEGPGEFKLNPYAPGLTLIDSNPKLIINSPGKMSLFSLDGKFISEKKINLYLSPYPVGENYVSRATYTDDKKIPCLSFTLFDAQLTKIKDLYLSDISIGPNAKMHLPYEPMIIQVINKEIYMTMGKQDLVIDVFDEKGNLKRSIKTNYEKTSIPESYKQYVLNWFKNDSPFKAYWEYFKTNVTFKEFFPAIRHCEISDNRIYVFTYKRDKDQNECLILNNNGELLKRVMVSIEIGTPMNFAPVIIYKNSLYSLVANDQEEKWELHRQFMSE